MKTEEVNTPETTKDKIIKLSQMAKKYIWMSSGFNSEFYDDPAVKKAMVDAFERVDEVKLLIEGNEDNKKNVVGWLFDAATEFKGKIKIKQCERVPHWLIIDGKHFRLEKPHPIGEIGNRNLVVFNIDRPDLSEVLKRKFCEWWDVASSINS